MRPLHGHSHSTQRLWAGAVSARWPPENPLAHPEEVSGEVRMRSNFSPFLPLKKAACHPHGQCPGCPREEETGIHTARTLGHVSGVGSCHPHLIQSKLPPQRGESNRHLLRIPLHAGLCASAGCAQLCPVPGLQTVQCGATILCPFASSHS